MILDNEEQRSLMLGAIEATSWPGKLLEAAAKLKASVREALIVTDTTTNGGNDYGSDTTGKP